MQISAAVSTPLMRPSPLAALPRRAGGGPLWGRLLSNRSGRCYTMSGETEKTPVMDLPPVSTTAVHEQHDSSPSSPLNYFAAEELMEELSEPTSGNPANVIVIVEFLALLLIAFPPIHMQGLLHLMGVIMLCAGLVTILYAFICLGRNFSPMTAPRKVHQLVTSGMYAIVRHPMGAGLILMSIGYSLYSASEARFALALLLWVALEFKTRTEEQQLLQRYPEYAAYQKKVHKFIPCLF